MNPIREKCETWCMPMRTTIREFKKDVRTMVPAPQANVTASNCGL